MQSVRALRLVSRPSSNWSPDWFRGHPGRCIVFDRRTCDSTGGRRFPVGATLRATLTFVYAIEDRSHDYPPSVVFPMHFEGGQSRWTERSAERRSFAISRVGSAESVARDLYRPHRVDRTIERSSSW